MTLWETLKSSSQRAVMRHLSADDAGLLRFHHSYTLSLRRSSSSLNGYLNLERKIWLFVNKYLVTEVAPSAVEGVRKL